MILLTTNLQDSDSDNDTILDDFEADNGLNPLDINDADDDSDGDGVNNLNEYLNGTDPQDPLNGSSVLIPLYHMWLNRN